MDSKQIEKKIASLVRTIERFNNKLIDLGHKYGTLELYLDRSSTCGGLPEEIRPFIITFYRKDSICVEQKCCKSVDRWDIRPERDEEDNLYLEGVYDFVSDLDYTKKCIRAAERFYKSEDPDRFLESDGDEDE